MTAPRLILSLFPGIGLLDSQFEAEGFCVVRGPDLIFGGDVREFTPPAAVFDGIIGGPPCQDFSAARRTPPTGNGVAMLKEWCRIVQAAGPRWWLMENVPGVPDVEIDGYEIQRLPVDNGWYDMTRRSRVIQWGRHVSLIDESQGDGGPITPLDIPRGEIHPDAEPTALASDDRSFGDLCRLQGLPAGFELPSFTEHGRKQAVGNGVPLPLGRVLARAVLAAAYGESGTESPLPTCDRPRRCPVCESRVTGRQVTCSARCRKVRSRDRRKSRDFVRLDRPSSAAASVFPRVPNCDRARPASVTRPGRACDPLVPSLHWGEGQGEGATVAGPAVTCDSPGIHVARQPVTCDGPDGLVPSLREKCDSAIATVPAAKCDSTAAGPAARDAAAGTSRTTRPAEIVTDDVARAASGLTMRAAHVVGDDDVSRKPADRVGHDEAGSAMAINDADDERRPTSPTTMPAANAAGDEMRSHSVTLDDAAGERVARDAEGLSEFLANGQYPGGKGAEGVWQWIVAHFPPHRLYVEPFAGSAAIARRKAPALRTILIDADPTVTRWLRSDVTPAGTDVIDGDGVLWLETHGRDLAADALIYADPPYVLPKLSDQPYNVRMTNERHERLLSILADLPCRVVLSGYASELYADRLPSHTWRVSTREVQTRWGGNRIEHLWHNFDPQTASGWSWQDPDTGFRERQRISRKAQRWAQKVREMSHTERAAVLAEVLNAARDAAVAEL